LIGELILKKLFDKLNAQHWKMIATILMCYDFVSVVISYTLALYLRFDFKFSQVPVEYMSRHGKIVFLYAALTVAIYYLFSLYKSVWRYASYFELLRVVMASAATTVLLVVCTFTRMRMPLSYYAFGAVCQFCMTTAARFSYRFLNLFRVREQRSNLRYRVAIYGAGECGLSLMRSIVNGTDNIEDKICCFFDDNPNKWGRNIDNIPIHGGKDSVFEAVEKYKLDKIYFAIVNGVTSEQKRDILQVCSETSCQVKLIPSIQQLVNGEVKMSSLRDVPIEALLGRETIKADMSDVFEYIKGKTVLVTGGGGSIGSELCRQVAAHDPKRLVILDIYENNAYSIQLELRSKYPELDLVTLIGSVRDSRRVCQVFEKYRPDIVYHAAAHKHVPLMEDSPCESIKNNVIGTYKTAYAAAHYGCGKFVLISTDKAVNPTNVMGASKRLCEMVVQSFNFMVQHDMLDKMPAMNIHNVMGKDVAGKNGGIKTEFVAVRFGNVLGSNGSVVPLFKKQIAAGGPVTVTHPDIIRYFMTVPEAVSLVMLAGTFAHGGEIFVLDMGSPVKIDTLARNLILLSGHKPDVDIKIEYTGLRPGEKLYEEKLMAEEGLKKTSNDLIHIGNPIPFDNEEFVQQLIELEKAAYDNDEENIRSLIMRSVSTYKPNNI